jgi:hypothetical protein
MSVGFIYEDKGGLGAQFYAIRSFVQTEEDSRRSSIKIAEMEYRSVRDRYIKSV